MAVTHLSVTTPAGTKFDGDVELAIAPGVAGDLGALANHAPMLTTLRVGVVKANVAASTVGEAKADSTSSSARIEFAVDGGLLEVLADAVIVLTDTALARGEIDAEALQAEIKRAEEALAQKKGVDDAQERRSLAWAQAKLEVARRPTE